MTEPTVRRALLSVSDKTGIIDFARALAERGIEIISTGGTCKTLAEADIPVIDVAAVTGFPEIMDGRVKTLHPKVHGALLGIHGDDAHDRAMHEHNIQPIDLLAVNLYPFEATAASGADFATVIENIDIGGPAMIRAAAKNHGRVTVAVDPADYAKILEALAGNDGHVPADLRRDLCAKAFARTAAYDAAISGWLAAETCEPLPVFRTFGGNLSQTLRYGENPHQWAGFYRSADNRPGVATARQIQGKALSYNNINDTDAAFELVSEFDPADKPAVAIIKHANPCGVALGGTLLEAYLNAHACDPVSAFGGIVATNHGLDARTAEEITKIFTEVIIAPDASERAIEVIAARKNLRLLLTGGVAEPDQSGLAVKTVAGGLLVQSRDDGVIDAAKLDVVTKRTPDDNEVRDLLFAFRVAKHVKSNAIVYAKDGATVGIGAGQMSRVDSARIAARKAKDAAKAAGQKNPLTIGSVAASDAFFPFADGLEALVEAGARAVIQPGGSMRDDEVIEAADKAGLAMVFTGMRHFRH